MRTIQYALKTDEELKNSIQNKLACLKTEQLKIVYRLVEIL